MDSCSLSPSSLCDITLSHVVTSPHLSKNDLQIACQTNSAGILQFVLAHIIIMFVHTCLFFFLPFIFALVCQSYSSFTLFFHLIHIHMHTHSSLVLTMAYTHARAHIQPTKIHTRHMYIFLIMHASARTHTHVYILFLALSFVGQERKCSVPCIRFVIVSLPRDGG